MGYTPTLVILKKDMDKHRYLFLAGKWQIECNKEYEAEEKTKSCEDGKTIMEYLKFVYEKHNAVIIGGIGIVICQPEFTAYNASVRKMLRKLEIEFAESN